ncbi:hypothetical protein AN477_00520 [Alicyclobacillus ferrooxydans]|uniref:Recombinase family protein n=2 Tax=Alicyclobacillus ferrooxydans TaxID=471514 RepID=A0A0N8PPZ7_9BACL|nr:hypothetical protein AN477_00520 [Alicyclobacillus ferrooxydans]
MQGESLENQVDYALEYIRRLGLDYQIEESCIYTDFDQSGYYTRFLQRPAIERALHDARERRYDVIVFKEISRISRDQAEHIEIVSRFTQYGVRMIAINDNLDSSRPETLDLLGIHSVMAELESKRISSRVSSGKKSLARRGQWTGEAPIGYVVNKETKSLEEDMTKSEIPRLIFRLYTEEGYGTLRIAAYLNERALFTKNGKPWSRVTVHRVLCNPAYRGDLVYGRTRNQLKRKFDESGYTKSHGREKIPQQDWIVVSGAHPALIDDKTFQKAQSILAGRSHNNPRRSRHPLTGILTCGRCGAGLICQMQRHDTKEYRYYSCSRKFRFGKNACTQPNVNADEIEALLSQWLFRQLSQLSAQRFSVQQKKLSNKSSTKRIAELERALERAQTGLTRLLMDTSLSEDTVERLKLNYVKLIESLEEQIQAVKTQMTRSVVKAPSMVSGDDYLNQMKWQTVHRDRDRFRQVVHGLVQSVTVDGMKVKEIALRYDFHPPPSDPIGYESHGRLK